MRVVGRDNEQFWNAVAAVFQDINDRAGMGLKPYEINKVVADNRLYYSTIYNGRTHDLTVDFLISGQGLPFFRFSPDENTQPFLITPSYLERDVERYEFDYYESRLRGSNDVEITTLYESIVLKQGNFADHFKKRRRVAGSLTKYEKTFTDYYIEDWSIDRLKLYYDHFTYCYINSENRFYQEGLPHERTQAFEFLSDYCLYMNLAEPCSYFDRTFVLKSHNSSDGLPVAYAHLKFIPAQGVAYWRATHYDPVWENEYKSDKLGTFMLNWMYRYSCMMGLDFDMGIDLPYKELWKPDYKIQIPGFKIKEGHNV